MTKKATSPRKSASAVREIPMDDEDTLALALGSVEDAETQEPVVKTVHPRNLLNDLTAPEWISETVSVWRQKGLGKGHPDTDIERQHPAPFSFTDVARLIRFFSKSGDLVLDPFLGVGSTLKAAAIEGRDGVGIELSPVFAALSRERLAREVATLGGMMTDQQVLEGDSREVLRTLETDSVDFVVTSPPYWNILHKKDHKARQERVEKGLATRYSEDDARDLGNIDNYETFVKELVQMLAECGRVLRPKKYMAIVVSDFRDGGRFRMFHADLASALEEVGFVLKGITILHQAHKRVFPYGYPAAFVPNIHHQYILILRNEPVL